MQLITKRAFDNFKAANETYSDSDVLKLEDALNNWVLHKPCKTLRKHLDNTTEPLQVVRDRLIVDHMVQTGGLTIKQAINVWCDWEDYEWELREVEECCN